MMHARTERDTEVLLLNVWNPLSPWFVCVRRKTEMLVALLLLHV